MSRVWVLATAVLLVGCPDEDGSAPADGGAEGLAEGEGEGEGEAGPEVACQALCERLEADGMLCGGSDLGRSVTSCTDTCAGGGGAPEGLDLEADCRTLTSALPDGMVLPCLCAPDVSQFDAIAAGPIAPCVGCHPAFGGDSAYDEVVGRIADLLKVDESKLFCNAMGCSGHPGGDVWGGTGSCAWRTLAAWAVGAALPGEDCEDFDEAVSCVVQCGDEPPPEVDCDPGDHEDADDYCRFVAEVETKVIADCGLCHGTGSMGFSAKTGDSDANYAVALTKIDRDNPDDSTMLIKSTGGGGHPVRWSAEGCAFLATRAWIAKTEAPACLEDD